MDVLKPDLMYLDGCCYRLNPGDNIDFDSDPHALDSQELPSSNICLEEPSDEDDFNVEVCENGRFKTSFHISRIYFPLINGLKGATRKRLGSETCTSIIVPKQGMGGDIIVAGKDQLGVATARRRIKTIVMAARRKHPFSHFLSLSMAAEQLQKRFLAFKEQVLASCGGERGVEESIFQSPGQLHLTLGVLVLTDAVERAEAADLLQQCHQDVILPLLGGKGLRLQMRGIEYMNDDPAEVDVLFAKVQHADNPDIVQNIADSVVDYFAQNGILQKETEKVKLHVTLMNTRFRPGSKKKRETFDATSILKDFEDFDFGEAFVDCMHLSQRYCVSKDTGYYQDTGVVSLV